MSSAHLPGHTRSGFQTAPSERLQKPHALGVWMIDVTESRPEGPDSTPGGPKCVTAQTATTQPFLPTKMMPTVNPLRPRCHQSRGHTEGPGSA